MMKMIKVKKQMMKRVNKRRKRYKRRKKRKRTCMTMKKMNSKRPRWDSTGWRAHKTSTITDMQNNFSKLLMLFQKCCH